MPLKKFANELSTFQLMIYEYFKKETDLDGYTFKDILDEIEDGFESVPEKIYNTYQQLNPIERVEVIHFFTKYLMRNYKD